MTQTWLTVKSPQPLPLEPDPKRMSKVVKSSTALENDSAAAAALLLAHYSFDLGRSKPDELVEQWLKQYPANWVRLAVIEALYQGRYKAISVEQILTIWTRRNQAIYHFKHEFERLVCSKLPEDLLVHFPTDAEDTTEAYKPPEVDAPAIATTTPTRSKGEPTVVGDAIAEPVQPYRKFEAIAVAHTAPPAPCRQAPSQLKSNGKPLLRERCVLSHPPIHQFTPTHVDSELYNKLKAITLNTRNPNPQPQPEK